jgi:hypothetical protein
MPALDIGFSIPMSIAVSIASVRMCHQLRIVRSYAAVLAAAHVHVDRLAMCVLAIATYDCVL